MSSIVPSLYQSVIDDVTNSVRDAFLDDGLDEQVLAEFKQTWERKLFESKVIEVDSSNNQNTGASSTKNSSAQQTTNNSNVNNTTTTSNTAQKNTENTRGQRIVQLDGGPNSSEEDEDEDDFNEPDNDDDQDDDQNDDEIEQAGEEEEPLNSEDDVSDEDPIEIFDTENVVVCQYDKVTRSRNKWKFNFKDGIMNLQGKDYVFQKANGDAEW